MERLMEKRAGNMLLIHEKDEELEYIVVKPTMGHVEIRLRNDTMMFMMLKELMEKNEESMYGIIAHLWYLLVTAAPDGEFIDECMKAYDGLIDRFGKVVMEEESEDDEDKTLEDLEFAARLEEALFNGTEEGEA